MVQYHPSCFDAESTTMIHVSFANNLETKKLVLELLGKKVDEENMITESDGSPVLDMHGQRISVEEFGGVRNGSEIFFKKDLISCVDFYQNYLAK